MTEVVEAIPEQQEHPADTAHAKRVGSAEAAAGPQQDQDRAAMRSGDEAPVSPDTRDAAGYSELLVVHHDRGGVVAEEYRALRTSLLAQCGEQRFAYVVTSAEQGEGKTVTCANLALAMAEIPDKRTLLIDADLRRGGLACLFGQALEPGVADVLRADAAFDRVVRATAYPNLFLVAAGHATCEEVGELIVRPALCELLRQAFTQYDYVLVDSPAAMSVADACMLGRAAGAALVVVRMNKTTKEAVARLLRLLRAAHVQVGGIVLTHARHRSTPYSSD